MTNELAQRLQDHMEQHHGVVLKASEWDAVIRAMGLERPPEFADLKAMQTHGGWLVASVELGASWKKTFGLFSY